MQILRRRNARRERARACATALSVARPTSIVFFAPQVPAREKVAAKKTLAIRINKLPFRDKSGSGVGALTVNSYRL